MCCVSTFGFVGVLFSMLLRGGCCPTEVPVALTLSVAPASIVEDGGTATLTATLAEAYAEDVVLTLEAEQTPAGDPGYTLSASSITIAAGETTGTATVTSAALPEGVEALGVVFRISQVAVGECSWEVDIRADVLTIAPEEPPSRPIPSNLRVTLGPDGAVTAGARWSVDGGAWRESGATVTGLSAGRHTVTYVAMAGWTAPATEEVVVSEGGTAEIVREYVPLPGALQVNLSLFPSPLELGCDWHSWPLVGRSQA